MLGFKVLKYGSNKYKAHDVFTIEKSKAQPVAGFMVVLLGSLRTYSTHKKRGGAHPL